MSDRTWDWEEAHRYKGSGNWEVGAESSDRDYGFHFSLADDGEFSATLYLPPGSGFDGALAVLGEALSRINKAKGLPVTLGAGSSPSGPGDTV